MIRKATRPDYYKPVIKEGETEDVDLGHRHIAHCIDAIRQSVMCASDITPYTWQWSEEKKHAVNSVKYPHVCRNFDKVREWATDPKNTIRDYMDGYYREMNDPLDPRTWVDGYRGE
jgi:hypothetical protein